MKAFEPNSLAIKPTYNKRLKLQRMVEITEKEKMI